MSEATRRLQLTAGLAAFGADFSKWPAERVADARESLLRDADFRLAWEAERKLDRAIATARDELNDVAGRSGAVRRVREATLARLPHSPLGRIDWRRIAAAILVAGMLGGAVELILAGQAGETADVAIVDPVLYGFEPAEIQ